MDCEGDKFEENQTKRIVNDQQILAASISALSCEREERLGCGHQVLTGSGTRIHISSLSILTG
jgi:hypothetical protein